MKEVNTVEDSKMNETTSVTKQETIPMPTDHVRKSRKRLWTGAALVVIAVLLVVAGWHVAARRGLRSVQPSPPQTVLEHDIQVETGPAAARRTKFDDAGPARTTATRAELEAVYHSHIMPMISEMHQANLEAAERAMTYFEENFGQFYVNIEPFVRDLTTYRTRFGVVRRMASDKARSIRGRAREANGLETYIAQKFSSHILTEEAVQDRVQAAVEQFADDVVANRNTLLAGMDERLSTGDIPLAPVIRVQVGGDFQEDTLRRMVQLSAQLAGDSVVYGLASYLAGELAYIGVRRLTPSMMAIAGTTGAAVSAQVAGQVTTNAVSGLSSQFAVRSMVVPATAKAMAGGGTVGAAGGPAGVVAGVTAGLVAGLLIDLWLTSRFERRAAEEMQGVLDELYRALAEGQVDGEAGDGPFQGLHAIMRESAEVLHASAQEAILAAVLGDQ